MRGSRTLPFRPLWREILEHFGNAFVQVLFILLGFAGDGIFRRATPNQLLRFCIVQVNYKCSFLVVLLRSGRFTKTSKAAPAPSPAHSVIKGLQCSLGLARLNRHDANVSSVIYLAPAL